MNTQTRHPDGATPTTRPDGRTLNALEQHFRITGTDERTVSRLMNILQANGIISDNCLAIEDIELFDAMRALQWLQANWYLR